MRDRLWITWEKQRRNRTLSLELGATLCEYPWKLPRVIRYPLLLVLTFFKILTVRPSILFVQNPSIVLAFFSVLWCRAVRIPVVVDAHNSGVFPFKGKKQWANIITNVINRTASYIIVSNDSLKQHVEMSGGRGIVLPDPIPDFKINVECNKSKHDVFKVLFVCTWASDEPYIDVIEAVRSLDGSVHVYMTGDYRRIDDALPGKVSNNVTLTGYLSDVEYEQLLSYVDVVMDLTTMDDCLVCGAYESVAAEKPIILSNNSASRAYFNKGVVHIENTVEGIVDGINESKNRIDTYQREIVEFKKDVKEAWKALLDEADRKFNCIE